MMTEDIRPVKTTVFDQKAGLSTQSDGKTVPKHYNQADSKRYVTYRWCSRIAASRLPGADLAVEYLYGKYIKNLPM